MLTADLVRAKRQKRQLVVPKLSGKTRARAVELSETYLATARDFVGKSREELRQALSEIPIGSREKKLSDGLLKLLDDACDFSQESPLDPVELRRAVFSRSSELRQQPPEGGHRREAIIEEVAATLGVEPEVVDRALYADLRSAHTLRAVEDLTAEALVERYDRAQIQAVLLRAVRVTALVRCRSPFAYRSLFRALKFRRLLHEIEPRAEGGYRITIDGPYSLFDSVTKYGLQLALVLPALLECDELSLTAEVRWGKSRDRLTFEFEHKGRSSKGKGSDDDLAHLPDDVRALCESARKQDKWKVTPVAEILELPGVGLCVPDLVFERGKRRVFLEVLGFWSRDAVWKRVELAQAGLSDKVLFAVSQRLRVSEEVLGEVEDAALYVYKGTMSARAVLRKVDALAAK